MIRILSIGLLVLSAAACASAGATNSAARPAKSKHVQAAPEGGMLFTALPDSSLPRGKCGMILWTLESDRPTPIMRYVAGQKAEIAVNGVQETLTLTDAAGPSDYGVSEKLQFLTGGGNIVEVSFRFGLGFDGGSYVERGLVSLESTDGWRVVAPAAGIAGCRN